MHSSLPGIAVDLAVHCPTTDPDSVSLESPFWLLVSAPFFSTQAVLNQADRRPSHCDHYQKSPTSDVCIRISVKRNVG